MLSGCCAVLFALTIALAITTGASADDTAVAGTISAVEVRFQPADHPKLPSAEAIGALKVALMHDGTRLFSVSDAPQNARPTTLTINQLPGYSLSAGATDAVQQQVVKHINDSGVGAVACRLSVPKTGTSGTATINIVAGTISKVSGRSSDPAASQSRTALRIAAESPIHGAPAADPVQAAAVAPVEDPIPVAQDAPATVPAVAAPSAKGAPAADPPVAAAKTPTPAQLLDAAEVDEYLARLNRFPGRSVAATISAGDDPATLLLDYLVGDEKTFTVFGEVSNFGTESTSKWLEQFGAYITQLTNNDDILNVSVLTGNFQDTTLSVNGYYDARVGSSKVFRWRVTGNYGNYTAADVGFVSQNFTGTTWGAQVDGIWNCYQKGSFFLDLDLGFRYWSASTQNTFFGFLLADGSSNFLTPTLSLNAFDMKPLSGFQASIGADYTDSTADQIQLDELGRLDTSPSWVTLFGSASYSFYLDPLISSDWSKRTMKSPVHEVTLRGSGQWAFNYRLTPLAMSTLGGYYTVRGYPQSAIAGDSAVTGSAEYRLHLPRAFKPAPAGRFADQPFRWAPDSNNGALPDWDLALVGFFDAGAVWQSQALSYEENATLMGAGVGLELGIRQNVKIVAEYGWALKALESDSVASGDGQLYVSCRFSF